MGSQLVRSRWAAIGAAVAVTLGAGTGVVWLAHADSAPSSFVSVTPCRLFDTRLATLVGNRATPLLSAEVFVRQVTGTNGNCVIPATATAISYNLTVPDPPATGFIKMYPSDAPIPNASAINPVANGGTVANSGIVGLSATGSVSLFNLNGPIDALVDITGYFLPASAGPAGPAGPRGLSAWDVIPSGQTVTGNFGTTGNYLVDQLVQSSISLPARAPVALTAANVNFASLASDNDATCTGTAAAPTAPPGKVCMYLYSSPGVANAQGVDANNLPTQAFYIAWTATSGTDHIYLTWAYTAP